MNGENTSPTRLADELAFLPAALSLQDTPVHPAPRRLAYVLMGLFALAILWACVGEVDPHMASADSANVQEQLQASASEILRTQALLQALSKPELLPPVLRGLEPSLPPKLGPPEAQRLQAQLQTEWQDIRAKLDAETQRQLSDRNAQASSKHSQLLTDASKATQRQNQTQLRSPVDGVVQQLAVHSVGGVVTSAQPLMVVVPDATEVTAEVAIANQDIGFVNAGQVAQVKLQTFAYTQYGTVGATVYNVTADAVTDEKRGSYYPATLTLGQKDMRIDGKRVNLSPGMNITAEIKTGQRRIIEFLLSPVQRAGRESLRER